VLPYYTYSKPSAPSSSHLKAHIGNANSSNGQRINAGNYIPDFYSDQQGFDITTKNVTPLTITKRPVSVTGASAQNKTYDGNRKDNIDISGASLSGVLSGDNVNLSNGSNAGTFASANAGKHITVKAHLSLTGSDTGNYSLSEPGGLHADINPKPLTASIKGTPTKTYDGNKSATIPQGATQLNGFVGNQGATNSQPINGTYSQASAGSHTVSAILSASDFTANHNTSLKNYSVPGSVSGTGKVNPKSLTASIKGTPTKIYDGNKSAIIPKGETLLNGFVGNQGASASKKQLKGTYRQSGIGSNIKVSAKINANDFSLKRNTSLSNYTLPNTATGTGTIKAQPNAIRFVPIRSIFGTNNNLGISYTVYLQRPNVRTGFLGLPLHIVDGGVCND